MGKIHYARLAPMAKNHDEKKAWDFLVYLAGDNDLSEEMVWSLQEMNQAALEPVFHERIGLVALFDPAGGEPVRYDLTARRKRVKNDRGGLSSVGVVDRTLQRSEEVVQLVARFLIGAFGEPPRSTNRGVILSGHGSGALGDFLDDRNPPNGELGIPTLGRILRDIRDRSGSGIQILGLDSCQMSTIEVGYEVRDFVRYLVASEGPVANTGWPYRQVLQGVAENADAKPVVAARAVANRYLAFYRDYEIAPQSTDIAVTELSALGAVAGGVRDLAYALGEPLSRIAAHGLEELHELDGTTPAPAIADARAIRNAIVLAHWSAQSYKCDRYTDLRDFTEQLLRFLPSEGSLTEKVRHCSRRLLGTIDTAVMLSGATGYDLQHSHGLSIYFPWSSRDYFAEYGNLQFAKDAGWADFLGLYIGATERMRRFQAERMKDSLAEEPTRVPFTASEPLAVAGTKDAEAGTRRDAEAGTRRGKLCRSTMKNPPDGYYPVTGAPDSQ